MKFPTDDWQFWAVTAIALGALLYIGRSLLPGRLRRRKGKGTRTTLTVSAKKGKE